MAENVFNKYQIKSITDCFEVVRTVVNEIYKGKRESFSHLGSSLHWEALTVSVKEFDAVAKKICGNDLDGICVLEWQRIMFLTETVAHNDCRYDREKQQALAQGGQPYGGHIQESFPGRKLES